MLSDYTGIMKLYRVKDAAALDKKAADILGALITLKPDAVLGLATGSTPIGTYRRLIEKYESGDLDFSRVFSVNLDEYIGLSSSHPQSYRYFMDHNLFDRINIRAENTFFPDGTCADAAKVCSEYDNLIRTLGGIDLQLLGIGGNGHIGFNEPGNCFIKDTHMTELTTETRNANARFFSSLDEVPVSAYTMGIGSIFSARRILLLASGLNKALALKAAICGPITPEVPASILQLHPDTTIIADEDAFSLCGDLF